jgi:uncharacterized protein (DUF488 family)
MSIRVFSIGFTKTSARNFFERLKQAGVNRVYDVRIHNKSQLSGFAKSEDLEYFLRELGGIRYAHLPILAPEESLLASYRSKSIDWRTYEKEFLELMARRHIEERLEPSSLEGACLLCSEDKPHHCHRRLVLEYLNSKWGRPLQVQHL